MKHSRRWREAIENGERRRSSREAEEVPEEEEEARGSEGLPWNLQKSQGFTVNRIFPLIQSFNMEMVKIEVVEFFKSYNFALGLKFENLKHNALSYHFALK
jgi:hypothetical protein